MVAEGIEGVDVQAGTVGSGKTFAKFEVKDVVAKALALYQILGRLSQADAEEGSFG